MAFMEFLFVLALQAGPAPVGMVLQAEGKVTIQRGATQADARLADFIFAGDRVTVVSGRAAFLFCPTSERLSIGEGTSVELQAGAIRLLRGAAPARTTVKCSLPRVALGAESMERVGGLRPRGHPPIPLYVGGPITQARPTFEWKAIPEATQYILTLKDESGAVVWEHRTTVSRATYPETMPLLTQAVYLWEVRAMADGKTVGQQSANFEVKAHRELQERLTTDVAGKLALAVELENLGYYAESASYFRELRVVYPDDDRISRRLAWLYWNAGLIAAANEELEKLKPK